MPTGPAVDTQALTVEAAIHRHRQFILFCGESCMPNVCQSLDAAMYRMLAWNTNGFTERYVYS